MTQQTNAGITLYTLLGLAVIWGLSSLIASIAHTPHQAKMGAMTPLDCHESDCLNNPASRQKHAK